MTILPKRTRLSSHHITHRAIVRCTGQNAYGPHDAAILIMTTDKVHTVGRATHGNIPRAALVRVAQLLNEQHLMRLKGQ